MSGKTSSLVSVLPDIEEIPDELLAKATPVEQQAYKNYLREQMLDRSPLDFMCVVNETTARWPHIEYLNEHMVALCEYRLYADGPGPKPIWKYVPEGGDMDSPELALSYETIPEKVDAFWAEDPHDPTHRVVFRLAIAMPPRHGKSFLVSEHFPLWYWRRYGGDIAFATYSDDFAGEWGSTLRQTIDEHPEMGITLKNRRNDRLMSNCGSLRLVGCGGSLTGTGYQAGIIDDPFKDFEEARSQAIRNQKGKWYTSTFTSRKTRLPGGRIPVEVMMFTRWNQDDIAGRAAYQEDGVTPAEDWCVLRLPALAEEDDPLGREPGQALCPQVKTKAELLKTQSEDPEVFAALYQGNPSDSETGIFPQFQTYSKTVSDEGLEQYHWVKEGYTGTSGYVERSDNERLSVRADECTRFATVDLAATKNSWSDWTVMSVWDFHRGKQILFLVAVHRERVESSEHEGWLRNHLTLYPTLSYVGIENKTYGQTLIQQMQRAGGMSIHPIEVMNDKVANAIPYGQAVKRGQVLVPRDAPWLHLWTTEHTTFPNATHDDQVDTGSMAWRQVLTMPNIVRDDPNKVPVTMEEKMAAWQKQRDRRRKRSRWDGLRRGRLGA